MIFVTAIITMIQQDVLICHSFTLRKSMRRSETVYVRQKIRALRSVPDWLVDDVSQNQRAESNIDVKTITVRFTNTPNGKDVVVKDVQEGTNLLYIGDQNGIALPRACRTGLCGSCTCEVVDPAGVSATGEKGKATVRACSTRCFVPPGKEELIVDLWRLSQMKKKTTLRSNVGGSVAVEVEESFVSITNGMLLICPCLP